MASEIRVNKINSRTGVGTITLSPTGVDFTGITTVATLKATTGIVTTLSATGNATIGGALSVTGNIDIANKIVHTGDTNTAIRFPAADTFTVETAGSERLRITSAGLVGISTASPDRQLHVLSSNGTVARFESDNANTISQIVFKGKDISTPPNLGATGEHLHFTTNNIERLRITNGGDVGIGTAVPITASGYASLSLADTTGGQIELKKLGGATHYIWSDDNLNIGADYSGTGQDLIFKVNGNNERARILSSGGITFNGDTAAANALGDYEEGTWTATVKTTNNNQTITAGNTTGYYVKVGKMVTAYYYTGILNITAAGTGSAVVSGLPYSVANLTQGYAVGTVTHATCFANQVQNCYADPNLDRVVFIREGTVNGLSFTTGSTLYLMFSITYRSGL